MSNTISSDAERNFARDNLMRLANRCDRVDARGKTETQIADDLSEQDLGDIAGILRGFLSNLG